MLRWTHVALAATTVGFLSVLLVLFIRRWCSRSQTSGNAHFVEENRRENLQAGIVKLHQSGLCHQFDTDGKRRRGYYVFRRDFPATAGPFFTWSDHPALVTDAVENGWSSFGFTAHMSSPSTRSSLLGLGICAAGDLERESNVEISWEICPGSADFMQKIRLNSGLRKVIFSNNSCSAPTGASSVIRTSLPLPGPQLGNSAFPQEAYFELTILYLHGDDGSQSFRRVMEGERTKLIQENCNPKGNKGSLVHAVSSHHKSSNLDELKLADQATDENGVVMLSIGLASADSLPLKLPGSYPGSIGFNSDGSIYLEAGKLVAESEKHNWGKVSKVVGCGFDPRERKVFFTVDAELVQEIGCKGEAFAAPLYPTLAANSDVLVLVNFGQKAFEYAPANTKRTSNPCFIGPVANPPAAALGYDDSKELFSMGRIDSQWQNSNRAKGNSQDIGGLNHQGEDFDEESETDLFEIVLDHPRRSPKMPFS